MRKAIVSFVHLYTNYAGMINLNQFKGFAVSNAFVVKIIPTRCNNCVLFFANAFTLHVSGDNPTHHQEYMCCMWPQVSRHT